MGGGLRKLLSPSTVHKTDSKRDIQAGNKFAVYNDFVNSSYYLVKQFACQNSKGITL